MDLEALALNRGNKFLQLLDLLLFLLVGFLHLLDQQLAGFIPEVIVSGVQLDLAIVDICSLCTDLIQEVTVMGYYDNGIVKVDQELLKPFDSMEDPDGWWARQEAGYPDFRKVPVQEEP